MTWADDLDPVGKDQYTHRGTDEVVTVDQGIGDQFFPDDAWNLGLAQRVEALLALCGAGVGDDEAKRLLEHISQLAGDVAAVDVVLVFDLVADKGHRFDDESRQRVVRRFGEQQAAGHIELTLAHQVHVGQYLGQRQGVIGERFTEVLLEEGIKVGQVHIARAQARHGCLVGVNQTGLLEQALDFLARGGATLVGAVLYPDHTILVHVRLADADGDGDDQYDASRVRHVFGQWVDSGSDILRGRVGDQLVEPSHIGAGQAAH